MSPKRAPKTWLRLGSHIHQDFMLDFPDFFSGVADYANSLPELDRLEFIAFVRYMAMAELPGGTVKKYFRELNADVVVVPRKNGSWRQICEEILTAIDENRTRSTS